MGTASVGDVIHIGKDILVIIGAWKVVPHQIPLCCPMYTGAGCIWSVRIQMAT